MWGKLKCDKQNFGGNNVNVSKILVLSVRLLSCHRVQGMYQGSSIIMYRAKEFNWIGTLQILDVLCNQFKQEIMELPYKKNWNSRLKNN
jgi:hypothetical protein